MGKENNVKIYIMCGKARQGKDTVASLIKEVYDNKKVKVLDLSFAHYIKEYAKKITDWDGSDDTKPRSLLTHLGTDIIRKQIDEMFFIKRMIEDIKVYSFYYDVLIITDARLKIEVDNIKQTFNNVIACYITRPDYESNLSEDQKKHITEIDLDDYNNFDYKIINDGTIEDLKPKIIKLVEEIDKNEKIN